MLDRTDASNCGERMDAGHHGQGGYAGQEEHIGPEGRDN